jgi:hypothetical protein
MLALLGHRVMAAFEKGSAWISYVSRMLEIAQAKHPGIAFHHGDMVDFDLGRQFDVVASLFSSIGYLGTSDRLALAVANMARHVRAGCARTTSSSPRFTIS